MKKKFVLCAEKVSRRLQKVKKYARTSAEKSVILRKVKLITDNIKLKECLKKGFVNFVARSFHLPAIIERTVRNYVQKKQNNSNSSTITSRPLKEIANRTVKCLCVGVAKMRVVIVLGAEV